MAGSLGDIACFSFFPSKNMAVGGEGGMITTNDETLGGRMRSIINHGRDGTLQSQEVGTNMRMSEVFAAIGRKQLERLDEWLNIRRNSAKEYNSALEKNRLITAPSTFSLIQDMDGINTVSRLKILSVLSITWINKILMLECSILHPVTNIQSMQHIRSTTKRSMLLNQSVTNWLQYRFTTD
jgi:hypothetical protein